MKTFCKLTTQSLDFQGLPESGVFGLRHFRMDLYARKPCLIQIAARLWWCGNACHSRVFRPQIVYARASFAGGLCFLPAVNLLGAGGAVFCPAGAGENARAADFAAAQLLGAENGLFQLGLLGQHSAAEPPADQAAGDVLRTDAVQQQRIEYLRVVADAPQGFVLEKEPRERHIGRCKTF